MGGKTHFGGTYVSAEKIYYGMFMRVWRPSEFCYFGLDEIGV
jgi:hypothetical protein